MVLAELHSNGMPSRDHCSEPLGFAGALAGADREPAPPPIWADPVRRAHLLDGLGDQEHTKC